MQACSPCRRVASLVIIKNDDWIYTVQMNPEEYDAFRAILSVCIDEDDPHPLFERMLTQMNIHAMDQGRSENESSRARTEHWSHRRDRGGG